MKRVMNKNKLNILHTKNISMGTKKHLKGALSIEVATLDIILTAAITTMVVMVDTIIITMTTMITTIPHITEVQLTWPGAL